jgi:hypothetical protein
LTIVWGAGVVVVGTIVRARRALSIAGAAEAKTGKVNARMSRRRIQGVKRGCMQGLLVMDFFSVRIYRLRCAHEGDTKAMKWSHWYYSNPGQEAGTLITLITGREDPATFRDSNQFLKTH